jgi:hypothetical protein
MDREHQLLHELRPHDVAAISLSPGLAPTESVLEAAKAGWLDSVHRRRQCLACFRAVDYGTQRQCAGGRHGGR